MSCWSFVSLSPLFVFFFVLLLDGVFALLLIFFSFLMCGFLCESMWLSYEGDFVSYFICLVLLVFFSIPLFRLCLMLTMKDRENVSVCVFVFVWFVYLLILLIYFFYLVFFGISLVTPLCTLHPSAPLALNSFFSCLLLYFTIFWFLSVCGLLYII